MLVSFDKKKLHFQPVKYGVGQVPEYFVIRAELPLTTIFDYAQALCDEINDDLARDIAEGSTPITLKVVRRRRGGYVLEVENVKLPLKDGKNAILTSNRFSNAILENDTPISVEIALSDLENPSTATSIRR